MCGFVGSLSASPHPLSSSAQLSRRGPDDHQSYLDGDLSFFFRRLSIIDVESGAQPIWNEDRSLFIAINGEIYNYRELPAYLKAEHTFCTRSDAEIVLHLYEERGPDALQLLEGMFAITIWDKKNRRLFLARDRLGIKPLYYAALPGLFLFGSELKALLAHPLCPRSLRWADIYPTFFSVPYTVNVPTYIEGVEQLLGGEYAIYQEGVFQKYRYWSLDAAFQKAKEERQPPEFYIDSYSALFEESVTKHLQSDVPVGAFLSGGLDSSLLVAAAAKVQPKLHCFSVLERSTFQSGDASAARALTELLQLPMHQVLFDFESLPEALGFDLQKLEYFVWLLDSPRFHLEWLFKSELHRYAKTALPDLKVILLGQGADEFSGGYSKLYAHDLTGEDWSEFLGQLRRMERLHLTQKKGMTATFSSLLSQRFIEANTETGFEGETSRRLTLLQSYNLWHEDRSAAGNGIEARVPFLDHRLVELLVSVPGEHQSALFFDKFMLRKVAERFLPKHLTNRPKVGFFQVKDQRSILALSRKLLLRVFPEFLEKYSDSKEAIFDREAIVKRAAQIEGSRAEQSLQELFSCLSIEIFAKLCREITQRDFSQTLQPPSPLYEVDSAFLASWGEPSDEEEELRPTPTSIVSLSSDVLVLASLSSKDELCFLRTGRVEQEVSLTEETRWLSPLLQKLSEGAKLTAAEIASEFGEPLEDTIDALSFLLSAGWITIEDNAPP